MKRSLLFPIASLALLFLVAAVPQAQAQAQIEIGPRVGYEIDDIEALTLGGDVRVSSFVLPVQINGSVDYFFLDEGTYGDASLLKFAVNGLYQFGFANQLFTPYAGPGLSITRFSNGNSETDLGLNAVGGAEFGFGALRPFAQAELVLLGDTEPVQITAGLLFTIGGL